MAGATRLCKKQKRVAGCYIVRTQLNAFEYSQTPKVHLDSDSLAAIGLFAFLLHTVVSKSWGRVQAAPIEAKIANGRPRWGF